MSSWLAVIVFAILALCGGNRKLRTAADTDPAPAPVTAAAPIQPERDEKLAHRQLDLALNGPC